MRIIFIQVKKKSIFRSCIYLDNWLHGFGDMAWWRNFGIYADGQSSQSHISKKIKTIWSR